VILPTRPPGSGSGIAEVAEDTSPTLGGNLGLGGFTVGDADAADLTKLSEVTASSAELNFVDGVTSNIQTQINAAATDTDLTNHAADTTTHGTTGDVVGTSDTQTLTNKTLTSPKINENVAVTATATELNYTDGVTSAIQTQLDGKSSTAHTHTNTSAVNFVIDGGGSAITTGVKGWVRIPWAWTNIAKATITSDQTCEAVVDVWKSTFAGFPPVDGGSITSATPPTLTGPDNEAEDTTLSSWTKTGSAGDFLSVNVDSNDVAEIIVVTLDLVRSV
jgi:hypothetical protein